MNLEQIKQNSDLGINAEELLKRVQSIKNGTLVDLGVRGGDSSSIMLFDVIKNNNTVFGVDVNQVASGLVNAERYNFIKGDSVTIGKKWNGEKIDLIFIDTLHIKEQVMREVYSWLDHLNPDATIVFHDTNWPEGKCDVYGGESWGRVEEGVKEFFGISSLNYEDDFIKVENYPESWGMTFVKLKGKSFKPVGINWVDIFSNRNRLINLFWNETNSGELIIDLNLKP